MSEDAPTPGAEPLPVLDSAHLPEGSTHKFHLRWEGRTVECFAFRRDGRVHAWVNECRHIAMSLDWIEHQFFTEDGAFLLCPTHGALYEPTTGECVAGPPCGRHLHRIPLEESDGRIRITGAPIQLD